MTTHPWRVFARRSPEYGRANRPKKRTFHTLVAGPVATADPNSSEWKVLDSRSGESFSQRLQTNAYAIKATAVYTYYQLRITGTQGGGSAFQVSDFALLGTEGTATSLLDGMSESTYWDSARDANTSAANTVLTRA